MEALHREINRVAPAAKGAGARDAAIWLAIRDDYLARSEPGYFVSGDHHFGHAARREDLHPDLRAELSQSRQPFEYTRSISALLASLAEEVESKLTWAEIERSTILRAMVQAGMQVEVASPLIVNELVTRATRVIRYTEASVAVQKPTLTLLKFGNQKTYLRVAM